jgi:hypothetical protein
MTAAPAPADAVVAVAAPWRASPISTDGSTQVLASWACLVFPWSSSQPATTSVATLVTSPIAKSLAASFPISASKLCVMRASMSARMSGLSSICSKTWTRSRFPPSCPGFEKSHFNFSTSTAWSKSVNAILKMTSASEVATSSAQSDAAQARWATDEIASFVASGSSSSRSVIVLSSTSPNSLRSAATSMAPIARPAFMKLARMLSG